MDRYAKAVVAALIALGATYDALAPGVVTGDEWVRIIITTVVAGVSVWAVPNDTTPKL